MLGRKVDSDISHRASKIGRETLLSGVIKCSRASVSVGSRGGAGPVPTVVNVGSEQHPEFSADHEKVDNAVRGYWTQIWEDPGRDRDELEQFIVDSLPQCEEVVAPPIGRETLEEVLKNASGV